jgi:hypothetical protein
MPVANPDSKCGLQAKMRKEKAVCNLVHEGDITYYPSPIAVAEMSFETKQQTFPGTYYLYTETIFEDGKEEILVHASTTRNDIEWFLEIVQNHHITRELDASRICIRDGVVLDQELMEILSSPTP